jgi:hypothetical protein
MPVAIAIWTTVTVGEHRIAIGVDPHCESGTQPSWRNVWKREKQLYHATCSVLCINMMIDKYRQSPSLGTVAAPEPAVFQRHPAEPV